MIALPPGCHPDCRACRHRTMTQEQSLQKKSDFLSEKLQQWSEVMSPVRSLSGTDRWGYRTRTTLGVQFDGQLWKWGLWRRDSLLHIPDCPVHHPGVNLIIKTLMDSLPFFDFGLRWLVLSGKQLTMVIKSRHFDLPDWPAVELTDQFSRLGVDGLWLHLNPSTGKRIFGKGGWKLLWGKAVSKDVHGLFYGPSAFSQLIPMLSGQALEEAYAFLKPDVGSAVVDLYCGTGSSMQRWLEAGAQVIGVEASPEAARLASLNFPHAEVLTGACRQRLPQLELWRIAQQCVGKTFLLYANPPRTGIESDVLGWITATARPLRMAYLSCSPGTLSRDLNMLCRHGFEVKQLIPFDFFPQTHHIETLALVERVV